MMRDPNFWAPTTEVLARDAGHPLNAKTGKIIQPTPRQDHAHDQWTRHQIMNRSH
jgi:hypothetical protein